MIKLKKSELPVTDPPLKPGDIFTIEGVRVTKEGKITLHKNAQKQAVFQVKGKRK